LGYGVICSIYQTQPFPIPLHYEPIFNDFHTTFSSFAMLLVLCFAGQLTGGHVNPAVTLSVSLSKGMKIILSSIITYMISQFFGAILGTGVG
jgi:glycerol uptake facilitator-like aquaporin